MKKTENEVMILEETVLSKIYLICGEKVMIDSDLAELYGVPTGRFNEQITPNIERFPEDFMFQFTKSEFSDLKSQFTTSRANYNQCSARPMAEMVCRAMILSNFALGFLLSIVINWSKSNGKIAGAMVAGFIGLLSAITIYFSMYSMNTMFLKFTAVIIDVVAYTIMSTVVGAIITGVMGFVKAKD